MKKSPLLVAATFGLMMSSYGVHADAVNINVTGNVVASPCIVNGGNGNISVDLGNIQASTLGTPGSYSTAVPFTISFTSCPTGTSSVLATFSGTTDPVAGTSYYKNTGTATNVAVALVQTSTGFLKGNGTTILQTVQPDRTVTMAMSAKAYSSAGSAMPGTIQSVVTATLTYQ